MLVNLTQDDIEAICVAFEGREEDLRATGEKWAKDAIKVQDRISMKLNSEPAPSTANWMETLKGLTKKEHNTILAALRLWQLYLANTRGSRDNLGKAVHVALTELATDGDVRAMTTKQIDKFIDTRLDIFAGF